MSGDWITALVKSAIVTAAVVLGALIGAEPRILTSLLAGLVFLLTFANEYWGSIRPTRRLREAAPIILDELAASLMDWLRQSKMKPRLNVLLLARGWRWFGLRRRYFKVVWSVGMENHPDVNIKFPVCYGVAGKSLREGRPVIVDLAQASNEYKLPKRWRSATSHLTTICSYPIYEPKENGRQSGRILGVLNLDSEARHAYNFFTASRAYDQIDDEMKRLAIMAAVFYR